MILLIDNYDSFAHNLARYFRQLEHSVSIVRNDQITIPQIESLSPTAIVLSPGPCRPVDAGISLEVAKQFAAQVPMLGVCLGHQVICEAFGAKIVRAQEPMHGRSSMIHHDHHPIFDGIETPFRAGRYHSLVVDRPTMPDELAVIATTDAGVVMSVAHTALPVYGVQFHPESILSEWGYDLLSNFLKCADLEVRPDRLAELKSQFSGERKADRSPIASQ